jgi:molybdenum cofactor biosynthesis enzyme MoaA
MSDKSVERSYYCSMKFRYIKIDLESQNTYTCHAAQPHRVDFEWLKNNKGNLFNNETNVAERQMMLANQRAPSCEQNCFYAEDQGMTSPRLYQEGQHFTHSQLVLDPEILDITVGADCNLTCSYCCKEFSSSWRNDIKNNGEYPQLHSTDNRYKLTLQDQVSMKIKQRELTDTKKYNMLLDEIRAISPKLKKIEFTGGEPFLNNHVIDLIKGLELTNTRINIYSGLGVDPKRFNRLLDSIKHQKLLQICVSAECTEKHLEFNRYGTKWNQFLDNLQAIRDRGIAVRFHSVLTNLTVFDFVNFYKYFSNDNIVITFAYQPRMMSINNIDNESKQHLIDQFDILPAHHKKLLVDNIQQSASDTQKHDLSVFLQEFVKRRKDLSLDIYPKSFLEWLNIKNVV